MVLRHLGKLPNRGDVVATAQDLTGLEIGGVPEFRASSTIESGLNNPGESVQTLRVSNRNLVTNAAAAEPPVRDGHEGERARLADGAPMRSQRFEFERCRRNRSATNVAMRPQSYDLRAIFERPGPKLRTGQVHNDGASSASVDAGSLDVRDHRLPQLWFVVGAVDSCDVHSRGHELTYQLVVIGALGAARLLDHRTRT